MVSQDRDAARSAAAVGGRHDRAGSGAAPDAALRSDHEPFSEGLQAVLEVLGPTKTRRYGQAPLHLAAREGSYGCSTPSGDVRCDTGGWK